MTYYFKLYCITLITFLLFDMLWLGVIASKLYQKHLDFLLAAHPNWLAAILFYLLFIAGMMVFVIVPGLKSHSLKTTLLLAAFFGLVTYATYDLTNLATLENWPLMITVIDMTWGVVLSVIVAFTSFFAARWLI